MQQEQQLHIIPKIPFTATTANAATIRLFGGVCCCCSGTPDRNNFISSSSLNSSNQYVAI
jgi:hypothetical protein